MTYVALIRGINVGGKNKVQMADLRLICSSLGWENIETYIQSGNIIFDSHESPAKLESIFKGALKNHFSISAPVMIIPSVNWLKAVEQLPFKDKPIESLHLTWLASNTVPELTKKLETRESGTDQAIVADNKIYLKIDPPYHKTKLSNQFFEKTCNTQATTRNWKTVLKIQEMLLNRN